jgi:hypothetical protein
VPEYRGRPSYPVLLAGGGWGEGLAIGYRCLFTWPPSARNSRVLAPRPQTAEAFSSPLPLEFPP